MNQKQKEWLFLALFWGGTGLMLALVWGLIIWGVWTWLP